MYVKPDASDAIKAFLSRGGTVKRIDAPTDAERVRKAMIKREESQGLVTYTAEAFAEQAERYRMD